jgi:hypothetical protein
MQRANDVGLRGAAALSERLRRQVAAQENDAERLHALLMLLVTEQARQTQLLREILAALRAEPAHAAEHTRRADAGSAASLSQPAGAVRGDATASPAVLEPAARGLRRPAARWSRSAPAPDSGRARAAGE